MAGQFVPFDSHAVHTRFSTRLELRASVCAHTCGVWHLAFGVRVCECECECGARLSGSTPPAPPPRAPRLDSTRLVRICIVMHRRAANCVSQLYRDSDRTKSRR
ncbi:uncharacterized protein LOC143913111 [Arctopsyche grandis]|uniref:uncharacterized protein LOC143913111 n=1 Tax=Arctopsyche grandis TaxID=121162 RepID=UPI00406D9F3D